MYKAILVIIDGLGDYQYEELGNKSPLEAANKEIMDFMAKNGETGFLIPIAPYIIPGSDTAHLSIFGYDPYKYYQGRGVYEALGANLTLEENDIAFRANLAYVENNIVKDRRAGREPYLMDKLYEEINGLEIDDVKVIAKHTSEHRGVIIFKGLNLSNRVTDVDPHKLNVEIKESIPLDESKESKRTSEIVNKFTKKCMEILSRSEYNKERIKKGLLPANAILIRGAGKYKQVESIERRFNVKVSCIAGGALYKGIGRFLGMKVYDIPGATGDKNTNLKNKLEYALKAKEDSDIVFLHIKATDAFGHDGKFKEKKEFIEKIDKEIMKGLIGNFDLIVITGDHSTPCKRREHSGDPVPILAYGINVRKDHGYFSEVNPSPSLFLKGPDVMNYILNKIERLNKFGE